MPKIDGYSYADLHCDSVTACCKTGGNMLDFAGQVNFEKLQRAGCFLQCFALFTEGEKAAEDFDKFLAFYNAQIAIDPRILPVERYSDIEKAEKEGRICALLTVENLGFTGGDISRIPWLKKAGVTMASLVWNNANAYAYPNLVFRGDLPDFNARCDIGLTEAGRAAVAELNKNKIIIDISHLSDGGADDILALSTAPIVASHSNCQSVCGVSRNLTDGQLKRLADKGGVAGLNFCRDFVVGRDGDSVFEGLYRHYINMVNVGGEDLPALGSDFDGIPPYEEMRDCAKVPELFEYFHSRGVKSGALEKLARGNFLRVFKEAVG